MKASFYEIESNLNKLMKQNTKEEYYNIPQTQIKNKEDYLHIQKAIEEKLLQKQQNPFITFQF